MSRTKRTQRGRRTELSEQQTLETRLEHYRREGKEHRMRTLMWGTVGSIMIMLGSYGSGWLADSSDFWRSSIIRTIRYDPSWIIACVVLVAAGGMTPLPQEQWWREAQFAPPLETAVLAGRPWLPPDVAGRIRFR